MSLCKDLVFLILQFCDEENLKNTAHMLEKETAYFFDLKYFQELVLAGIWDEAEKYLSSFTAVEDNKYSTKIYFEIRKQKFLEALDKREFSVALDVLLKDLKVFSQSNKELYKEMAQLLVLEDIRENNSLASYGDTLSARKRVVEELRAVIEANPLLQGKTRFPQINKSRLRRLINQSLNWQHIQCAHPHPQPHIDTLFTDHKCPGPDNMQDQLNKDCSLLSDQSSVSESIFTPAAVNVGKLSDQTLGEIRNCHDASNPKSINPFDEVASPADCSSRCQGSADVLPSEFPATVERVLNVGSFVTSMDFHPVLETLLLVGKSVGSIYLWDVASEETLFTREFTVGEANDISGALSEKIGSNPCLSVNRVRWSPGGSKFGVAFSERIVHLYNKNGDKQFEIDAHVGCVNDIAFSKPYDKLVVISCGDDKLIQVWDAETGAKQYTFEGHRGPVYSLCPHSKENVHFLFSITRSGEIKAWLFDNCGSRITYCAPGLSSTRMAYSADGKRLFSCGTNENGESYIVEWSESEGFILRTYNGLSKYSSGVVRLDTTMNRYLAAGDDHVIKIWDMDNAEILAVVDADGGLIESPYICFNEKGNLLAVADDYRIKILANDHGRELLQKPPGISYGCLTESFRKFSLDTSAPSAHQAVVVERDDTITEETPDALEKSKPNEHIGFTTRMEMPNISKIVEVPRCQSLLLTSDNKTCPIRRLVYTHTGNGILALAENGTHLLWRWLKSGANLNGEATMKCHPQLRQPKNGALMVNDLPDKSSDVVTPCLSLSKNDSYVISASGKMINLYNMLIFKRIRNVMPPPPAATCLMFYPQDNNIIAIGMDDSTILIYNIRMDELISKLEGHSKRISGLAFSTKLNVLVSCGVDTQIVLWDSVTWERKKTTVLQISIGWMASDFAETNIELDKDEKHFLAVHETQLAIYETTTLRRVKQWTIANFCTRISHATYSCDSELVYAAMRDGILLILGASDLTPRFEIDPSAYLPGRLGGYVDPVVVAAHPHRPYQFALGLSNGLVAVIEPLEESRGKWTISSPQVEDSEINLCF